LTIHTSPLHTTAILCCHLCIVTLINSTYMYILPQLTGAPALWLCTSTPPVYIVITAPP
jgi:hypothetical protein